MSQKTPTARPRSGTSGTDVWRRAHIRIRDWRTSQRTWTDSHRHDVLRYGMLCAPRHAGNPRRPPVFDYPSPAPTAHSVCVSCAVRGTPSNRSYHAATHPLPLRCEHRLDAAKPGQYSGVPNRRRRRTDHKDGGHHVLHPLRQRAQSDRPILHGLRHTGAGEPALPRRTTATGHTTEPACATATGHAAESVRTTATLRTCTADRARTRTTGRTITTALTLQPTHPIRTHHRPIHTPTPTPLNDANEQSFYMIQ